MAKTYVVYILASRSRNLYTGVTNNLRVRLARSLVLKTTWSAF
jgi:predicted GIY-YIG superfamily endonuclease